MDIKNILSCTPLMHFNTDEANIVDNDEIRTNNNDDFETESQLN